MARPRKCRRICQMPHTTCFEPQSGSRGEVCMTLDEYEAIRLIDGEGMQQEECALSMNVARTTVQAIYLAAREKLADVLVHGKTLRIEGGQIVLCTEEGTCGHCCENCIHRKRKECLRKGL